MKNRTNSGGGGWKRSALIAVCVVLGLILGGLILATAYYETLLNRINRPGQLETMSQEEIDSILESEAQMATGTGPVLNDEDITISTEPAEVIKQLETMNIMLVGQDAREGDKKSRSDAMILCTIRPKDNTVILTSFLRDSYVKIPGIKKKQKLNAAYMYGGMELLAQTMKENYGIEVDNMVEVDFDGFMEIVDIMGGVEIELTKQEANYLNRHGNWNLTNDTDWTLKEGVNLLDGSQALAFSRIRYIGTDFARVERQKMVLTALVDKVRDISLPELNELVMTLASLITTDMTNAEITGYVFDLFPMLADLKIVSQRVPYDKSYSTATISGVGDVIVVDFDANRQFLKDTLGDGAE